MSIAYGLLNLVLTPIFPIFPIFMTPIFTGLNNCAILDVFVKIFVKIF
jgi:hypothetical protein